MLEGSGGEAMTEAEWLNDSDTKLREALAFLEGKASDRKMRLFICACCRLVWDLLGESACREAVEVGELYADGEVTEARFQAVSDAVDRVVERVMEREYDPGGYGAPQASTYACCARGAAPALAWSAASCAGAAANMNGMYSANHEQVDCLRDIIGNPFRPVVFSPAWRTDTAVGLARQMYASRDFGAMPILADALQDAGCESDDILSHCRDPKQVHVRGCWVVDLVLGKE
jgi:hypothetical protein